MPSASAFTLCFGRERSTSRERICALLLGADPALAATSVEHRDWITTMTGCAFR